MQLKIYKNKKVTCLIWPNKDGRHNNSFVSVLFSTMCPKYQKQHPPDTYWNSEGVLLHWVASSDQMHTSCYKGCFYYQEPHYIREGRGDG